MPPATASSRGAFWLVRESEQQTYCHLLGVPCRRHVGQRGSPEGGVEPSLGHLGRLPGGREARAESWRQSRGTGQEGNSGLWRDVSYIPGAWGQLGLRGSSD